ITTLYREVMPQGLLVNAEAQLRNQLTQLSGSVNGESVLTLLSSFAGALQNGDGVTLHRINYNQKSNDMQVVMAASNNANLLKFIDRMEQAGLVASAQNMTRTGEEQQATVIVSRRML